VLGHELPPPSWAAVTGLAPQSCRQDAWAGRPLRDMSDILHSEKQRALMSISGPLRPAQAARGPALREFSALNAYLICLTGKILHIHSCALAERI
jgi:hypothetical protein